MHAAACSPRSLGCLAMETSLPGVGLSSVPVPISVQGIQWSGVLTVIIIGFLVLHKFCILLTEVLQIVPLLYQLIMTGRLCYICVAMHPISNSARLRLHIGNGVAR